MVRFLLEQGADPDFLNETPLVSAAHCGCLGIIWMLLGHGLLFNKVETPDIRYNSASTVREPLPSATIHAMCLEHAEMFHLLGQKGAVLIPEALRKTIILRLYSIDEVLLSEMIEVGESSIEAAVQQGQLRIAQILRKYLRSGSRK